MGDKDPQDGDEPRTPTGRVARFLRGAGIGMRGRRVLSGNPAADVAAWVDAIGDLKGIPMKVGQIMSHVDLLLPAEVQDALVRLQTQSTAMPFERVETILQAELGDALDGLHVDPTPLAAASIGQVHRGRTPDGDPVVVKVQFPEVEAAIQSDFRLAAIGPAMARLFAPYARIGPLIEEAREQFLLECDYTHEATQQGRFARWYADDPDIVIPPVHEHLSTRRVLVSGFVDGADLPTYLARGPSQAERDRVGAAIHRFYVGSLFTHGVYNGDPHPGNQLYLADGRVAILDHGCVVTFAKSMVDDLARLTLAAHSDDDEEAQGAAVWALGLVNRDRDLPIARQFVAAFFRPFQATDGRVDASGPRAMGEVMENKRRMMRLHLPGRFLFLLRIRFGLASILSQLDARARWADVETKWAARRLRQRADTRA